LVKNCGATNQRGERINFYELPTSVGALGKSDVGEFLPGFSDKNMIYICPMHLHLSPWSFFFLHHEQSLADIPSMTIGPEF
jgi:hypothetical protein